MGGRDKSFATLGGVALVERVVARLKPQVDVLAISANGDDARFAALGVPVLPDAIADQGPLAGVAAGLAWAATLPEAPGHLVTVAVDTPFFPEDLVARLATETDGDTIAIAASGGRTHPVFALWPAATAGPLATWLARGDDRSIRGFLTGRPAVTVAFPPTADGLDPFFNVNTPDDLARAERVLAARGAAS